MLGEAARSSYAEASGEAFDRKGFAGYGVDPDDDALKHRRGIGDLAFQGHLTDRAGDRKHGIRSDHALRRSAHPQIGDIGGSFGQDLLVGGLDVGVRSDDAADFSVQIKTERFFFRRVFRMKIHDDDLRLLGEAVNVLITHPKRAIDRTHRLATLKVQDRDFMLPNLKNHAPVAGDLGRIVRRPEQPLLRVEERSQLILLPNMVSACDRMDAEIEELVHQRYGKTEPVGGVLTVGDHHIRPRLFDKGVQAQKESPAPGLSGDIPEKQGRYRFLLSHDLTWRTRSPGFRG